MIAVARRRRHDPRDRVERQYVDFAKVPPSQWRMHDRLENWARWCRGRERQSGGTSSPVFAMAVSTEARTVERMYGAPTSVPIDKDDATRVAKGVAALPDKHRRALHWSYLHPRNASNQARELAVSLQGLADLVRDGRQMLVNRAV